jgi:hypothetical protein
LATILKDRQTKTAGDKRPSENSTLRFVVEFACGPFLSIFNQTRVAWRSRQKQVAKSVHCGESAWLCCKALTEAWAEKNRTSLLSTEIFRNKILEKKRRAKPLHDALLSEGGKRQ